MRLSVVISTYNRAESLRATLDALVLQRHEDFEVIVVNGPSDDGTAGLLAARPVRVVDCPERNLSVSRNLGIEAAAGEVVAFIDDDAVPEARWLTDLEAAYDSARVGGAGGLVLDHTGVLPQYRYSVCDRIGRVDYDQRPPLERFVRPDADPFLYLQGTNCSFRRDVLVEVGGFDEEIEYNYDEAEVCMRVLDAGYELRALERAVVHHKFLPSHMRRAAGFTDPFLQVKNRAYFALRWSEGHLLDAMESLVAYVREQTRLMGEAVAREAFTEAEAAEFEQRAAAGFALGVQRGLGGVRRGRALGEPGTFQAYPVVRASRTVAVVGDVPFSVSGFEVHRFLRDDDGPYRIDFEDGEWVHRFPVGGRWIPELEGVEVRDALEHAAAVNGAVQRLADRVPVDVVFGSVDGAAPLLCALSGRWPVVVADAPADGPLERALARASFSAPAAPAGSADAAAPPAPLAAVLGQAIDAPLPPGADLATLLSQTAGLDHAAAAHAAERLMDPARFPVDMEAAIRRAMHSDDAAFVDAAFRAILGRPSDGDDGYASRLAGGEDRIAIVREIATTAEARARELDLSFLEALPEQAPPSLLRALGSAWLLPGDDEFAAALVRALDPGDRPDPVERALRTGATRAEVTRALLKRPTVVARIGRPSIDLDTFRSEREIAAALAALRDENDIAFVIGAYRLILGREPDQAGLDGFTGALASGRARATVVRALASSEEAAGRGFTSGIADRLAGAIGQPLRASASRLFKGWRA